jgi:UDPglucose 6-dehydrogenase
MKPDRSSLAPITRYAELLKILYDPFTRNHERMIIMDVRSAEVTKYAANAMLATKISFMNELSNLAERMGADIEKVSLGIGSDPRIGYSFIYPGCGYGGSCFPKDVQALVRSAHEHDFEARLLSAIQQVNHSQKQVLYQKIHKFFGGNLFGRFLRFGAGI